MDEYDVILKSMKSCIVMMSKGPDLSSEELENIRRVQMESSFLFKKAIENEMYEFMRVYKNFKDERGKLNV